MSENPDQATLDLDQVITVVVPFLPVDVEQPAWHLEPFSGKETRCPKCQVRDVIKAFWHDKVATFSPCYQVFMSLPQRYEIPFPEHIDRTCPVCHYAWTEGLAAPGSTED